MTALSVTQFKLVHDSVNRNAAEEHITTRFASTRNCLGRFCSFQTLMQLHEKQNPHLAYLIARVEDATGDVDFYDGVKAVKFLSHAFRDLLRDKLSVKSVTFFEYVENKGGKKCFRQVVSAKSSEEVDQNKFLQKYLNITSKESLLDMFKGATNVLMSDTPADAEPLLDKIKTYCLEKSPETVTPEVIEVLSRLSNVYYAGEFGHKVDRLLALHLLEKVLELDPNNARCLCDLGVIYYDGVEGVKQNRDLAKALLEAARKIEGDFDQVHHYLGKIALDEGDVKAAKACLEEAFDIRQDNVAVALLLAEVCSSNAYGEEVRDFVKAMLLINGVLKIDPQNEQALSIKLAMQHL